MFLNLERKNLIINLWSKSDNNPRWGDLKGAIWKLRFFRETFHLTFEKFLTVEKMTAPWGKQWFETLTVSKRRKKSVKHFCYFRHDFGLPIHSRNTKLFPYIILVWWYKYRTCFSFLSVLSFRLRITIPFTDYHSVYGLPFRLRFIFLFTVYLFVYRFVYGLPFRLRNTVLFAKNPSTIGLPFR